MKRLRRALCTLGIGVALAAGGRASAEERLYRVEPGETLASISLYFYGTESFANSLRLHNGVDGVVEPGRMLRVPLAERHEIVEGDSWSGLAERYWGDAGRYRELAELSGRTSALLEPGGTVRIPALIEHRVRSGESFAALSRRIYGGPERARALARLNPDTDPARLAVGQLVRVPVLSVAPARPSVASRAVAAPPVASSAVASPRPPARVGSSADRTSSREVPTEPADPAALGPELDAAIALYQEGRFEQARRALEDLRKPVLARADDVQRERLLRHLVFVYTAFDEPELVCRSAHAREALATGARWDPIETSPRVLEALEGCE